MANGTYGIRKPAYIQDINDAEVFYHYRPTRGSEAPNFSEWKSIEAPSVLSPCRSEGGEILPGMFNLRLPLDRFNKKGIYSIYIKPKEIVATIYDVSTLTGNFSSIRGIVIQTSAFDAVIDNGSLIGYRVEFIENGTRLEDYRIITSNNKCEPVSDSGTAGSAMQKSVRYRFNDSSTLMFCTLTPNTAMSFKSSSLPYIGKTGQEIRIINTKFNPVMIEVEMTTHDVDTISTMLEGSQLRDLDHGLITTFDEDGNIYHQATYGNITNPSVGMNIDFKLKYGDSYIREEEDRLEEVKAQVTNGGQI